MKTRNIALKDYIKKLREDRDLTQKEFAEKLEISSVQVSRIENDESLPGEPVIEKLGIHYGADTQFIYGQIAIMKAKKFLEEFSREKDFVNGGKKAEELLTGMLFKIMEPSHMIAVLNRVACGGWKESTDLSYPIGHADRYEAGNSNDPHAFYVIASGESMIGADIKEGDLLLVEPSREVSDGNIVLAWTSSDGVTIKKFFHHPDQVELRPMNPDFKSLFVKDDPSLRVYRISANLRKL